MALATTVSVASEFTRQSLERLDLRVPVVVASYGFPVDQFPARVRRPSGPFRVLAVGTHDLRKGTPYLLEAWRRAEIPDAELHLVGPLRLSKTFLDRYAGTFHHRPHIPKSELGDQYAAADVLAFPTLGDGFGLVIQEAMCCGTPVITTPCGGGPECITDGVDGWIVPPRDVDALVQRLRECAADRDRTYAVGQAARRAPSGGPGVKPGLPPSGRLGSDVRVLYLNPFSQEVSGPDESLRTLLAVLVRRGLEPHLVLPAPGPQVERYQRLGVQVHFLPLAPLRRTVSLQTLAYPAQLLWAAGAVAALARRIRADLIHTNMEVLLEGGLAARLIGRPHVLHYRGNTLDQPKWVFDALVALWVRTSDWIFCISEATADIFRRRGRGQTVQALHNPLDLATFAPRPPSATVRRELGAGDAHKLIGTVGRIHPRKDLETFIRAAARVSRAEPRARFAIVGAAEGPAEETLSRAARRPRARAGRCRAADLRRGAAGYSRRDARGGRFRPHRAPRRVRTRGGGSHGGGTAVGRDRRGRAPGAGRTRPLRTVRRARRRRGFRGADPVIAGRPEAAAARGVEAVAAARQFDAEAVADQVWSRYRVLVERA